MKHVKDWQEWRVDEVRVQDKERLGQGAEHVVYPSITRPGRVIKKFTADEKHYSREQWKEMIRVSKEHPEIFAVIYQVDLVKGYFIQEKLDVNSFTSDCQKLDTYLRSSGIDEDYPMFQPDLISYYYLWSENLVLLDEVRWAKGLAERLTRFIDRLENAGYGAHGKRRLGDLYLRNMGYSATGEIKILDFNFISEYY